MKCIIFITAADSYNYSLMAHLPLQSIARFTVATKPVFDIASTSISKRIAKSPLHSFPRERFIDGFSQSTKNAAYILAVRTMILTTD